MTPVIDQVEVEVYVSNPGAGFSLNTDRLDHGTLGAAATANVWAPILGKATTVTTRRGANRDDLTTSAEVGVLECALVNADDPAQAAGRVRPSTPIRLIHTPSGQALFTGTVADVLVRYEMDKSTGRTTTFTTLTAVDAVRDLANTPRYGAVVASDDEGQAVAYETWEARIRRLMRSSSLPYDMPPEGTLIRDERVVYYADFSGGTSDPPAPDPEQANWQRPGNLPGAALPHRVGSMWETSGRKAIGFYFLSGGTYSVGQPLYFRTLTGLTVGRTYRARAIVGRSARVSGGGDPPPFPTQLRFGVTGVGHSTTDPLPDVTHVGAEAMAVVEYTWTATSTTHDIGWSLPVSYTAPEGLGFTTLGYLFDDVSVSEVFDRDPRGLDWTCQSIVYESNLANHLDLACNTVRAQWWVDRNGVVQFRREFDFADPLVRFSDNPSPDDPLGASYTGIDADWDTRSLCNVLSLENHGRTIDETGAALADDRTLGPWSNVTSSATYGPRLQSVETSLYVSPDPQSAFHDAGASLARSYLADYSRAALRIRSLTFNARDRDDLATLDLYDGVEVTYRDNTQTSSVLAISHEITPFRWRTTLDLIERR